LGADLNVREWKEKRIDPKPEGLPEIVSQSPGF
jgi:hypothetical protein